MSAFSVQTHVNHSHLVGQSWAKHPSDGEYSQVPAILIKTSVRLTHRNNRPRRYSNYDHVAIASLFALPGCPSSSSLFASAMLFVINSQRPAMDSLELYVPSGHWALDVLGTRFVWMRARRSGVISICEQASSTGDMVRRRWGR
jgi:hypothetical protein